MQRSDYVQIQSFVNLIVAKLNQSTVTKGLPYMLKDTCMLCYSVEIKMNNSVRIIHESIRIVRALDRGFTRTMYEYAILFEHWS